MTGTDRPDYVVCVEREPGTRKTYCGRPHGVEFLFLGLEHAAASVGQGSRLVPCEQCLVAAQEAQ